MTRVNSQICAIFLAALITVSISGCKRPTITGQVNDYLGNPLSGATVAIEKSAYRATSDAGGRYSINYAPGTFALLFSKAGWTTIRLDLTISDKTTFPAQPISLYPVPSTPGVFYLAAAALEPLPSVGIESTEESVGWLGMTREYRYYLKDTAAVPTLAAGKQRFIDAGKKKLVLIKIKEESGERLLLHGWHDIANSSNGWTYNGTQSHASDIVGDEKVLVRTATLSAGRYAWVEYGVVGVDAITGSTSPDGMAYEFTVGNAETVVARSSATADAPSSTVSTLDSTNPKEFPPVEAREAGERRAPDTSKPRLRPESRVEAQYSEVARKARLEGVVVVRCSIDEEGNVVATDVVKPLPFGLDAAAVVAVRQWKFRPALKDSRPVASTYDAVVQFSLNMN